VIPAAAPNAGPPARRPLPDASASNRWASVDATVFMGRDPRRSMRHRWIADRVSWTQPRRSMPSHRWMATGVMTQTVFMDATVSMDAGPCRMDATVSMDAAASMDASSLDGNAKPRSTPCADVGGGSVDVGNRTETLRPMRLCRSDASALDDASSTGDASASSRRGWTSRMRPPRAMRRRRRRDAALAEWRAWRARMLLVSADACYPGEAIPAYRRCRRPRDPSAPRSSAASAETRASSASAPDQRARSVDRRRRIARGDAF